MAFDILELSYPTQIAHIITLFYDIKQYRVGYLYFFLNHGSERRIDDKLHLIYILLPKIRQ